MGKFKTESRLKEKEIAEEFEVSRGPVREALRELAQDGLVAITAHRGAIVSLSRQMTSRTYSGYARCSSCMPWSLRLDDKPAGSG